MDSFKAIPQLFFDLIARIVPGAVAIFAWCAATNTNLFALLTSNLQAGSIQEPTFLVISMCLGLAYFVGHLLAPSGTILSNVLFRFLPPSYQVLRTAVQTKYRHKTRYPALVQEFLIAEFDRTMQKIEDTRKSESFMVATFICYDWLNVHKPSAGTKAQKLYAEYFMYAEVTVALFSAVAFLHPLAVIINFNQTQFSWKLLLILGGACVTSFIGAMQHFRTFQWNVLQQYYVVRRHQSVKRRSIRRVSSKQSQPATQQAATSNRVVSTQP